MRLKLDENLGHSIAEVFQDAGHDVVTVHAQGMASAQDREVFETCRRERRVLVTLDLDFANPLRFDPAECWRSGAAGADVAAPIGPAHGSGDADRASERADITGAPVGGRPPARPAVRAG